MKRGGKREGAGRKPKVDELKLIEQMDKIASPEKALQLLWKMCESENIAAIRLWLAYRNGMPTQSVEVQSEVRTITGITFDDTD